MKAAIRKMHLTSFKNHDDLSLELGDLTNITGRNGEGKSGISEGVTWTLYGVDMTGGTKFEPKPLNADENTTTAVQMIVDIDGTETIIKKEQQNGKPAKYFVNDVPQKAKEFDEIIKGLFVDKNLFLSIFNPSYFFSQHWQDQRTQLLKYVSEPLNKEVFAAKENLAKYLEERLKKNAIDDIEKIYRPKHKEKDTEYERAAERVLTLKEQLGKMEQPVVDVEGINFEMAELKEKGNKAKEINDKAQEHKNMIGNLESRLQVKKDKLIELQNKALEIKNTPVEGSCKTCGQALENDSLEYAENERKSRFNKVVIEGKTLTEEIKEVQQEIEELKTLPEPETVDVS
jgi:DNA repair exonuclease SbcCD ATPase subunit